MVLRLARDGRLEGEMEWELAACGRECDYEIRRLRTGRWIMRFVCPGRTGFQGRPDGYTTREEAVRAAARYASP